MKLTEEQKAKMKKELITIFDKQADSIITHLEMIELPGVELSEEEASKTINKIFEYSFNNLSASMSTLNNKVSEVIKDKDKVKEFIDAATR